MTKNNITYLQLSDGEDAEWKDAVIDECMAAHIGWDENNPRKSIQDLISWHVSIALDRNVSSSAEDIYQAGYAAGYKECMEVQYG